MSAMNKEFNRHVVLHLDSACQHLCVFNLSSCLKRLSTIPFSVLSV